MSYTALYRKFRPAEFGDVKGQDHIITTLQNQIKANRIGHAYLFCDHHRQRSYDNLIFLKYSFHFTSLLFMYHPRFIIFILCASTPNNACTASVRLRATTASPPPSAITITPSTSGVSSLLT